MFDQTEVIGHLGNNAELKFMPDGRQVCSFNVAADRSYKKDGEKVRRTIWYRCSIFGKYGETMCQYLNKGGLVYAAGELRANQDGNPRIREWEGKHYCNFELTVKKLKLLGGRKNDSSSSSSAAAKDDDFDFGDLNDDDFLDL